MAVNIPVSGASISVIAGNNVLRYKDFRGSEYWPGSVDYGTVGKYANSINSNAEGQLMILVNGDVNGTRRNFWVKAQLVYWDNKQDSVGQISEGTTVKGNEGFTTSGALPYFLTAGLLGFGYLKFMKK